MEMFKLEFMKERKYSGASNLWKSKVQRLEWYDVFRGKLGQ